MITILTPTYNRSSLLSELYKSLTLQTVKDFEWVVIDDGSTDDTESFMRKIVSNDCGFTISYFRQPNGGKHRAINHGMQYVKGEWTFIVDSDDILSPNAIEQITSWIEESKDCKAIAAVSGLKASKTTKQLLGGGGGKFRKNCNYLDVSYLDRRKYKLMSDKAEIYRTDLLLKFPFKEFEGERFLTERTVWDEIAAAGYKIRYYNEIIYYADYLEGGLTKSKDLNKTNFKGFTYSIQQRIKYGGLAESLRAKASFYEVAKSKGMNYSDMAKCLKCTSFSIWLAYRLRELSRVIRR